MVLIADRTTKVSLVAQVSGYVAGMEAAAKKTREVGTEAQKLGEKKKSFEELGRASLAVGAVAAAGIALAIAKYAEFDQAMSQVKAATQETTANMDRLRAAALEAGAKTQYSATEAANAIEELGKAGLTTEQILSGGLDGALTLAAAGGIGVADAAQTAAIAMKQFGLEGSALPHVADLLAAGAGKAVGDVSDLSQALNQAGLVANGAGQSIEDTTGVLAAFADAGLLGSDAGTSLKTAIIALQAPAAKSKEVMDQYGLSFYDANGKMLSFSGIAGQLQTHLGDLDDKTRNAALAQIFGNDALRSANVLYKEGADGIQKYIDQTNDSGYAAQVAADRTDNLAGDIERLGGSMDTALIQTGSGANDVLRGIVQAAGFLVDSFGSLPEPALNAALAVGAVAAGIALVGGAALVAVPKVAQMKTAMTEMGVSGKAGALGIGLVGVAVAGATAIIGGLVQQAAEQAGMVDQLADSYDKASGAVTGYTREIVSQKLASVGAYEVAKQAGVSQEELTNAVMEGGDALERMHKLLGEQNDVAGIFDGTSLSAYYAAQGVRDLGDALVDSRQKHEDVAAANADAEAATKNNTAALNELQGAAASAGDQVDDLANKIRGFGSAQLDVNSTTREFEAAIDDLTQSVIDNGTSLDVGEDKGRKNQAALDDLAKSSLALAAATFTQTGSQDAAAAAIKRGRDELVAQLGKFGITGQAAEDYADKLGLIPDNVKTVVSVTGVDAAETALSNLARTRTAYISAITTTNPAGQTSTNKATARATGGYIAGPGTGTSDSIPARLSNGEFVVTAAATARNRDLLEAINAGRGYAAGGYVSAPTLVRGGSSGPATVVYEQHFHMPPVPTQDPQAAATVIGREFARQVAAG